MLEAATTFPVRRGRQVLLKAVSGEGKDVVYLAAARGGRARQVIKTVPVDPTNGRVPRGVREERQVLARMQFAHLAAVLSAPEVEREGGFVMEHIAGRALGEITQRAADYAVLLPPELGLVVAHDAFAAAQFFHAFEGRERLHGNITPRTVLVSYAGEVKVAGYRPGQHPPADIHRYVTADLKPLAMVLAELAFEKFPQELAVVVPRLLEDEVTPEEAVAAVRTFLLQYQPTPEQRRTVAAWLADVFLGDRESEAREDARLAAASGPLLGPRRRVARSLAWVAGATALLALVGGGLLRRNHGSGSEPSARAGHAAPVLPELRQPSLPPTPGMVEPSPVVGFSPAPAPALLAPPAAAVPPPEPSPVVHTTLHSPRRDAPGATAGRLLRQADTAFVAGKRVEAVNLALQALRSGGGGRAHLALGEYYRSLLRYQEALRHYRAVVASEPDHPLGLAGVRLLEKKVGD